jgi:hypothetical protein
MVQQQCGRFWPVALDGGLCDYQPFQRKTGFVGAATTTLACFGSRLTSLLLLSHKAGSNIRMFALFWASKRKVRRRKSLNEALIQLYKLFNWFPCNSLKHTTNPVLYPQLPMVCNSTFQPSNPAQRYNLMPSLEIV